MSADSSTPVRLSGRYVLGERLAVGGMGEVHVATDERLARQVAVKLLHRAHGTSEEAVERFRREAVVVAGLLHPTIAQVYDYGVHDDGLDEPAHFIVMELAPGTDLAALLRHRGRLGRQVGRDARLRPLLARHPALPDADRAAAVRRRHPGGGRPVSIW